MCQNLSIIRLIFSCHFTIYLNKTNFPWPAVSVLEHIKSTGRWNSARYLNISLTRLIISIWSVEEIPVAAAGMSTRRARGESPRRLGPTLTTSWGYRGGGQQSLVLGQMFVVRNVTMLRYTRNQRGEICGRKEVGLAIVAAVWADILLSGGRF